MIDYAQLENDGFVHLPGLVPTELLAEFETVIDRVGRSGLARKRLEPTEREPFADLLQTGGDYRVRLFANIKNLRVVQEMGMAVSDQLRDMGFLDWAKLDAPLVYPTLRADPPGEMKYLLPFHQDYATQCQRAWRLWIPLREASAETGTMKVVPGTHKLGFVVHDSTDPASPFVPEAELGGRMPRIVEIAAGDGILFHPLLVHASVPAEVARMKYVLLVQVQDLTTLADPEDPDDPLPERLAMTRRRDAVRTE